MMLGYMAATSKWYINGASSLDHLVSGCMDATVKLHPIKAFTLGSSMPKGHINKQKDQQNQGKR